ncbi:YiiD C-terminal domain-containing protein [Marinobacter mobilis]|uniref:Thioesterase domain-containing protein, putative n=1 Tax=Marinobacter mobilis TaxID=488533 RepID=A0A1H3BU35_9GAMM|nr:YiiD C-terminal domain-containing protein [Marinobacter mobilis]SDX45326.1 thioesterase domain-containing protein, putative [Marinobacter mobilis]
MDLAQFQNRINDTIPLTRALGVRAEHYDGQRLVVSAPLEPNHNHQGTGFGGSLYSVAVVAAWGSVELKLADFGLVGNVVVQSGGMTYSGPVAGDFKAVGQLPPEHELARLQKSLQRHGKGRLMVTAEVYATAQDGTPEGNALATFEGRFVVQDARPVA